MKDSEFAKVLKEVEDQVKKRQEEIAWISKDSYHKGILQFNQMVHESKTRKINTLIHDSKKGIKV